MTNEEAKQWIENLIKTMRMETSGYYSDPSYKDEVYVALEMAIVALEQNVKLKEAIEKIDKWVHSGNRGNCDYFIVDQIEKIINGLKKDGTVSE